jgi:hypothetical protein
MAGYYNFGLPYRIIHSLNKYSYRKTMRTKVNKAMTIFTVRILLHDPMKRNMYSTHKRWVFTSVLLYFSGPSGSLMPALLSVENWVPLKPVLGGVRDVTRIHYPSCTDSIQPSLKFSCNFVVINASDGSLCLQIFILHNSRCQVLCGSCKELPRTSLQCCSIFLVLQDHWCQHYKVLRIEYRSSRC